MDKREQIRERIDEIDAKMRELFALRMEAVLQIASYKKERGLPIQDPDREKQMMESALCQMPAEELRPFYRRFLLQTMATSRDYQAELCTDALCEGHRLCRVRTLEDSYTVHFLRGGLSCVDKLFSLNRRVLVLTDSGVPKKYAERVAAVCGEGTVFTVPEGEGSKSVEMLCRVQEQMLSLGFTRNDAIVAVGGGVVGDLGGLCAALYMRGIDFYCIPTTVLAAVDASVGGKCAVNFDGYKNVLGVFRQPRGVLVDPELLRTLPRRQINAGLAEMIKIALTSDEALLCQLEKWDLSLDTLDDALYRAIELKARVVERDEREGGLRKLLNFGHTYGHAIESYAEMSALLHGECVAMGMLPMCSPSVRDRLLRLLLRVGLPTVLPLDTEQILPYVYKDKKRAEDAIDCVYVNTVGKGEIRRTSIGEFEDLIRRYGGGL